MRLFLRLMMTIILMYIVMFSIIMLIFGQALAIMDFQEVVQMTSFPGQRLVYDIYVYHIIQELHVINISCYVSEIQIWGSSGDKVPVSVCAFIDSTFDLAASYDTCSATRTHAQRETCSYHIYIYTFSC
jgi:hypothetical protein